MPSRYAGQFVWQSRADTDRDANLPAVSDRTDRHHPTESDRRPWRGRGGRTSRDARADARIARPLGFIQRHAVDGHVSPRVSVAKPIALGKTKSVGRHDASSGAARETDQREAAKLFLV